MFSIIFFRLWYLQVLSGGAYRAEAENNQVRDITVQAPRGRILDRSGHVLVDNRTALALQVRPLELPHGGTSTDIRLARKARRHAELRRLGKVIGMPYHQIKAEIRTSTKDLPASPVTLRRDVPSDIVYYLRENQGRLSRGQRRSRLRPQLPALLRGRAGGRLRRPGERPGAQAAAIPGGRARRLGRQGRRREHLRQRPARHQRHHAGPGRRGRAAHGRHALPARAARGQRPGSRSTPRSSRRASRPSGPTGSLARSWR